MTPISPRRPRLWVVDEFGHGGIGRYAVDVANFIGPVVDTVVATTDRGPVDGLLGISTTWFPRGADGRLAKARAAVVGLLRAARAVRPGDATWVPLGIRPLFELALVLVLRGRRARVVVTLHNRAPHDRTGDSAPVVAAARRAHHVVVHTEVLEDWARARGMTTVRLPFPPPDLGAPPVRAPAAALPTTGSPSGRLVVLFLGYLAPYKGPDVLLRAMSVALARRPRLPVHLVLAGAPTAELDLDELAGRLGLEKHVTLRQGWLEEATMAELLSTADVVALPYRSIDNSGIAALAGRWRLPTIASDLPPLRELLRNTALFVRPDDVEALADGLLRLPDEVGRLRAAAEAPGGEDLDTVYQDFARDLLASAGTADGTAEPG